jgi:uncharacterized protein CbrC (UPF0167 family)
MTELPLPRFRYHPDPVATGMFVPRRDFTCGVCHKSRGYAYIGPYISSTFGFENGDEICPWCIADGSAAREWNAHFVDIQFLSPATLTQMSSDARMELEFRTPSFLCLQQPEWLDHHGEAAAYLGEVGFDEYLRLPPDAQRVVRYCVGDKPDEPLRANDFVQRLRADGDGPTAYLFGCLRCEWYGAFMAAG